MKKLKEYMNLCEVLVLRDVKRYLEKLVDELVEELRFYDVHSERAACEAMERQISEVRSEIEILSDILSEKEGNLLKFNSDGSFRLWVVRIPEGGEQIVEHYDADITFGSVETLLEISPCMDVSNEFFLEEITHLINVTDDLSNCSCTVNKYYFVSNDVFENAMCNCDKALNSYEGVDVHIQDNKGVYVSDSDVLDKENCDFEEIQKASLSSQIESAEKKAQGVPDNELTHTEVER